MTIKLTKKQKIKVLNGEDVFSILKRVLCSENKMDRCKEHLWIVALSKTNIILTIELVILGSVNSMQVTPTDVFSCALNKKAAKIIMVHNHPSGTLKPSQGDIELTDSMQAIGDFLNTPIFDHLIITEKGYFSFRETGLLNKIIKESTYDLSFAKRVIRF